MAKMDFDWETWYGILQVAARKRGVSVDDQDAWREDFDAGKFPEDALRDEHGPE